MIYQNINVLVILFTLTTFLTFSLESSALPSQKRLWEKKYGYSTSCTLCHSKGGGSQLNSYGEDFQRFGMTQSTFATIEKRDSDKDSSTNLEEITAKSNPGDFASTVKAPTDWLTRIEESLLPIAELKKIFSDTTKFSLLEGTLFPEQSKEIEKDLNTKLSESDVVPTFYFAIKDQAGTATRVGVALFSTPNTNPDKLIVGVGVDLSGKIKNVVLIKNRLDKRLSDQKFLNQFKDKTYESPLQISKDIQPASAALIAESTQVIEAVKKSVLIIRSVFNKNKKAISEEKFYDYASFKAACSSVLCLIDR